MNAGRLEHRVEITGHVIVLASPGPADELLDELAERDPSDFPQLRDAGFTWQREGMTAQVRNRAHNVGLYAITRKEGP